jgi:hypothetical protein
VKKLKYRIHEVISTVTYFVINEYEIKILRYKKESPTTQLMRLLLLLSIILQFNNTGVVMIRKYLKGDKY